MDEATADPERTERGDRRFAPERIDHGVELAAGCLPVRLGEIAFGERHECVRTEVARPLQRIGVARGRDHPPSAEQLRGLHGDLADGPGCAEHEHRIALADLRLLEPEPGRHSGDPERSRDGVAGFVGERDECRLVDHDPLGQAAVGAVARVALEPDPRSFRDRVRLEHDADTLPTGRVRHVRWAGVEPTRRDRQVDRVQRRRSHLDKRLAVGARRVRPLAGLWNRADLAHDRGAHQSSALS